MSEVFLKTPDKKRVKMEVPDDVNFLYIYRNSKGTRVVLFKPVKGVTPEIVYARSGVRNDGKDEFIVIK